MELRSGGRARGRADERREGETVGAERVGTREEAAEEREREARDGGPGEGGDERVGEEERGHLDARVEVAEVAGGDEDGVDAARERGRWHWWARRHTARRRQPPRARDVSSVNFVFGFGHRQHKLWKIEQQIQNY